MVSFEISLDVFSGNPNPTWDLPQDKVKEFFEFDGWKDIMNPEDYGVSLDLGYRGFVISVITNEDGSNTDLSNSNEDGKTNLFDSNIHTLGHNKLPDTFRIYGSKRLDDLSNRFKPALSIENIREREKWLLKSSDGPVIKEDDKAFEGVFGGVPIPQASQELMQYVEKSIDYGGHPPTEQNLETHEEEEKKSMKERLAACNTWGQYYNPGFWNDSRYIRHNNCYNYAMNSRTNTFAQPGRAHNCFFNLSCPSVSAAARCDGVVSSCVGSTAYYYVALVVADGAVGGFRDYHWYHWNVERFFSHKPGQTAVRNWDNSGRIIRPESHPFLWPHNCDRGPYNRFCGYFYGLKGAYIR